MTLAVKVPDYEIKRVFWADGHFEGADLFRDTAFLEIAPPMNPAAGWGVSYWWASKPQGVNKTTFQFTSATSTAQVIMNFANNEKPGITANLRLDVRPWS
jgi:hypothetical protein